MSTIIWTIKFFQISMTPFIALLLVLVMTDVAETDEKCEPGRTGPFCEKLCPSACTTCDRVNETCTGRCKQEHNYGQHCEYVCPQFCDGFCDIKTGSCKRCVPSKTGVSCDKLCPANCQSTCDMHTMKCDNCQFGFTGYFCNEMCYAKGSSTTQLNSKCIKPCPDAGRYGNDCGNSCPENCKDGCYRDTGECVNCAEGFGGRFCNELCPENCLDWCNRYQGTCNNCKVGYIGERCSEKCPANCKDKCKQNTGHCIGCQSRFQGDVCNISCPTNCSGICDQRSGICKSCEVGVMNQYCNQTCNKNCKDGCKQMTGECVKCQSGFSGLFCDQTCSPYCRDECEQTTGECIGCIDRYTGRFCNATCPTNCLGNCDQYTGECDPKATENMMLKISCGVIASLFGVLLAVVIVKRRQLILKRYQPDYLGAIPEPNLDIASVYTGHKYYEIDDNNLVKDPRGIVRSNNLPPPDIRMPPPLPNQRLPQINLSPQQDVDLRFPPPFPRQRDQLGSPSSQQDMDLMGYPLPCKRETPANSPAPRDVNPRLTVLYNRDQAKSSHSLRVNNHFDCDIIFENEIYKSVDESFEVEMMLPHLSEDKEEQEEPEDVKYSVAVGGAPPLTDPDNEAVAVAYDDQNNVAVFATAS